LVFRWVRRWLDPREVRREGIPPDYRFSLANERTYLAWIRTSLGLLGGGIAVAQFLPPLELAHLREGMALGLLGLGGASAIRAVHHWARCERAIRRGEDLPISRFPTVLAVAVGIGAIVLAIAVVRQDPHG